MYMFCGGMFGAEAALENITAFTYCQGQMRLDVANFFWLFKDGKGAESEWNNIRRAFYYLFVYFLIKCADSCLHFT